MAAVAHQHALGGAARVAGARAEGRDRELRRDVDERLFILFFLFFVWVFFGGGVSAKSKHATLHAHTPAHMKHTTTQQQTGDQAALVGLDDRVARDRARDVVDLDADVDAVELGGDRGDAADLL